MERQGGWSELAETGDGPRLWRGPSTRKKGRHCGGGPCLRRVAVWKDRAGGAAAPSRERERRRTEHRDDRMQLGVDRAAGAALIESREIRGGRAGRATHSQWSCQVAAAGMVRLKVEVRLQNFEGGCGWCNDAARWYRLQVVAVRDFSEAAGGAAMIPANSICAAAW